MSTNINPSASHAGRNLIWRNGVDTFDVKVYGLDPIVTCLAGPDDNDVVPVSLVDPAGCLLYRLVPAERLDDPLAQRSENTDAAALRDQIREIITLGRRYTTGEVAWDTFMQALDELEAKL